MFDITEHKSGNYVKVRCGWIIGPVHIQPEAIGKSIHQLNAFSTRNFAFLKVGGKFSNKPHSNIINSVWDVRGVHFANADFDIGSVNIPDPDTFTEGIKQEISLLSTQVAVSDLIVASASYPLEEEVLRRAAADILHEAMKHIDIKSKHNDLQRVTIYKATLPVHCRKK